MATSSSCTVCPGRLNQESTGQGHTLDASRAASGMRVLKDLLGGASERVRECGGLEERGGGEVEEDERKGGRRDDTQKTPRAARWPAGIFS